MYIAPLDDALHIIGTVNLTEMIDFLSASSREPACRTGVTAWCSNSNVQQKPLGQSLPNSAVAIAPGYMVW